MEAKRALRPAKRVAFAIAFLVEARAHLALLAQLHQLRQPELEPQAEATGTLMTTTTRSTASLTQVNP